MNEVSLLIEELQKFEEALTKKSADFLVALAKVKNNDGKTFKLISGILYETLVEYKDKKDASASKIIESCVRFLISEWSTTKSYTISQLPSYIKASVKRLCNVENDLELLRDVGWSIVVYPPLRENSQDEVLKWFLLGVSQFCTTDVTCTCEENKSCSKLVAFELELQASKAKSFVKSGIDKDNLSILLTTIERHYSKTNVTKHHIENISSCVLDLLKKLESLNPESVSEHSISRSLVTNAVNFGGFVKLGASNAQKYLHQVCSDIKQSNKTLTSSKNYCQYTILMNYLLASFAKYTEFCKSISDTCLQCIKELLPLVKVMSLDSLSKLGYFLQKVSVPKNIESILKLFQEILQKQNLKFESSSEYGLRFMGSIIRTCMLVVNEDSNDNCCEIVEFITENILESVSGEKHSEDSKLVPVIMNAGLILVKVRRKLLKYSLAMTAAENTILLVPFDISLSLVNQWVKAKYILVNSDNGTKDSKEMSSRTFATALKGNVSKEFLIKILLKELEVYVSSNMQPSELLKVTEKLLEFDRSIQDHKSLIACHHTKALFELRKHPIDFVKCYELCGDGNHAWEHKIQIKNVEFLHKWNSEIENKSERDHLHLDTEELFDISSYIEKAFSKKWKICYLENTADVAHEASALACLFGNFSLGLKIIGALWNLLKVQPKSDSLEDENSKLWNICSALCEMSLCYVALRQADSAEKCAIEVARAWDAYSQSIKNATIEETDKKRMKLLFLKVQSVNAEIHNIRGRYSQASRVIEECQKDDYLHIENLRKSVSAFFSCCVVLMTSSRILEQPETRMMNQLTFFKRICSLKLRVLPNLQTQGNTTGEDQTFGRGLATMCCDLRMQLNLTIYMLENLQELSKSCILVGDPMQAAAYIQTGLNHAKYLRLKHWYLRFSLLRLKVLSMLGDKQFYQFAENFSTAVECKCKTDESWITADCSVLREEDSDDFDVTGDEIDSEILGSADSDAILIPTKKIDITNTEQCNEASSPRLVKKFRLKLPTPSFLCKKACSCSSSCDLEFSSILYEFAAIYANSFSDVDDSEEGLRICDFALNVIANYDIETMKSTLEPIHKEKFWSHIITDILVAKTKLLFLKKENDDAVATCKAAIETIDKCGFLDSKTCIMKAELYILMSYVNQGMEKPEVTIPNSGYLNAIIDAIAQPVNVQSIPEFHTPKPTRSRKRALAPKNVAKSKSDSNTSARKLRTKKNKNVLNKENFEIYEDNQTLPIPQLTGDRSPSPNPINVYDIDMQEAQNIKLSRQAATKRYRKKYGTTITNEAKERVRGRVAKVKKTVKKPTSTKSKTVSSLHENSSNKEDLISTFEKALEYSSTAGDFFTSKVSAQGLSRSYFASYSRNQDKEQKERAAAYHLLSIGIPMRWSIQMYLKKALKDHCKRSKQDMPDLLKSCAFESQHDFQNLIKNEGSFVNEVKALLPTNWTVCALSVVNVLDTSTVLLTRIRKEEDTFHAQIGGEALADILKKFDDIMSRNAEALKSRDVSYWWTQRRILNNELKDFIDSLPSRVLKHYSGLLQGVPIGDGLQQRLEEAKARIAEKFPFVKDFPSNIDILLNSWSFLTVEQMLSGVLELCGTEGTEECVTSLAKELEQISRELKLVDATRDHVILILDKDIQLLPWESTPQLRGCSVTRVPSIDLLKCQLLMQCSSDNAIVNNGVNLKDVSYILNPNGDLKKSEERFQKWFQSMKSWKGIISREPDQNEWLSSITDFDLFIYCGHGSGTKYVSSKDFLKVKTRAAALLMGCGSAKLDQEGVFEPNGIVLQYLMTGSPCIVGCLWKVTDKDIDNYLCKLIEHWADGAKSPISLSAVHARQSMKMQYINGAACVIYGLPIHCQTTTAKFLGNLPKI